MVVSVLDEGPWGVGLALRVVVAGDKGGKFAHGDWMPSDRKPLGLFAGTAFAEADEFVERVNAGSAARGGNKSLQNICFDHDLDQL